MIRRLFTPLVLLMVALPATAMAGPFVIITDRLSYSGTVTDPSGTVHTTPRASDGSIYVTPSAAAAPATGPVADAVDGSSRLHGVPDRLVLHH